MPTLIKPHVQHAAPRLTDTERDIMRWEDDGGPVFTPRPRTWTEHWRRIASALTERLPELADRADIQVACEDGTRSGAPATFYPGPPLLEIDTALFGPLRPASIDPSRRGDEKRYPVAWGAFVHEAAHAAHSRWGVPAPLLGTALDAVAQLLEESRAEKAHLQRRPADRTFLRRAARTLVLDGFDTSEPTDRWQAANAAALILARRDAGVFDANETEPVERALGGALGTDVVDALRDIWTAAHATGDEDGPSMLKHAQAWCDVLGVGAAGAEPRLEARLGAGELAALIKALDAAVVVNDAVEAMRQARAEADRAAREDARLSQAERARRAKKTARSVFAPGAGPYSPSVSEDGPAATPVTGMRMPSAAEKTAAGRLARALRSAAYRERPASITASVAPPGRLNMRQALAREAQKAAGATPTATPWTRTVYRPSPTPPLRVGIAVDVSASMRAATDPIASAAWIVARAAMLTDPESRTATVTFCDSVTAITAPGRTPQRVTEFDAQGGGHRLDVAIDALNVGLDLTRPGAGRLLVIASDGYFRTAEAAPAATRVTALRQAGCAVLWLAFDPDPWPLPGVTLIELSNPAEAVAAIGAAAVKAIAESTT
ncbi:VWA domain-containing protein [Streptomyces sp. NPDC050560]|uniref:VWA domain-containing protein n=1 Tax=Streptomyces sp. NPDC050560 TaxID=3365630 RepID=UPI00378A10BA